MTEKTDLDYFRKIFEDSDVSYEYKAYPMHEGDSMSDIGYVLILHPDDYNVRKRNSIVDCTAFLFTFNKKLEYVELN